MKPTPWTTPFVRNCGNGHLKIFDDDSMLTAPPILVRFGKGTLSNDPIKLRSPPMLVREGNEKVLRDEFPRMDKFPLTDERTSSPVSPYLASSWYLSILVYSRHS